MLIPDSPPASESNLNARVESGLRWTFLRQFVTNVGGTLGTLAYARFIRPEDLGAFGIALIVNVGLFSLTQAPIRDAIIYYQDEGDERRDRAHLSAAFWLLLAFSLPAILLVVLFAGALGAFYDSALAVPLTRVMALVFFFQAMSVVPAALLLKRFRFAVHEILQTVMWVILISMWLILSTSGYGAWSLVIGPLLGQIFWAVAVWRVAGFRPMRRPGRAAFQDILRFSRSVFGSRLITYLKDYIDNAVVGTLGEGALGWYSFGEDQSAFAVVTVGQPVAQIALPSLAAARDQPSEFRRLYLEMLRLVATLTLPMQIGVLVLADLGLVFIFGDQWLGAVPVLRAYLTFRLVNALLPLSDAMTSALGRPDLRLKVDLIQFPFFIVAAFVGLRVGGGIAGVAWSLAIVRAVAGIAYFIVTMRLGGLRPGRMARYLLPSAIASFLMGGIVHLIRISGVIRAQLAAIPQPFLADGLSLTALVLVGVVSFFVLLLLLDAHGFREVVALAWKIAIPPAWRDTFSQRWARLRGRTEIVAQDANK